MYFESKILLKFLILKNCSNTGNEMITSKAYPEKVFCGNKFFRNVLL